MPKVSVIVPTHNRAECLPAAINSILNQTFQDFEILVVDDASRDSTPDIMSSFLAERVKYIRHESNKGGAAARNTGIMNASSDYIAFLDDDDQWLPDKLDRQLGVMERCSSRVGAVYTGYIVIDRSTERIIGHKIPTKKGYLWGELLTGNCIGGTSSVLVRKQCFAEVGLFDEKLPSFQDYDLWIRIASHFQFEYVQEPLLKYYVHEHKISTNLEAIDKGVEILTIKYGQSLSFKRTCSAYYLQLGHEYCYRGDMTKGRQSCVKAITLYPFGIRHYLNYFFSFLGERKFKYIKDSKQQVFALLHRHRSLTH